MNMLKLFAFLFFLAPVICIAQKDTAAIALPMKGGKVYFEKAYPIHGDQHQNEMLNKAGKWLKSDSSTKNNGFKTDKTNGEITGSGIFKIITSSTGNYYLIKFTVIIAVNQSGCQFKAYDFYEKPIEKGISNEYSKIEYRWWDFRQGKPWSAEDATLFKGIEADGNALIASFEKNVINNAASGNNK